MKRIFSIILTVLSVFMIFFINSPSASATENITNGDLKQKYNEGIKDGAIDKSITYEQWEKIVAENEKALEKIKKDKVKGIPIKDSGWQGAYYQGFNIKRGDIFITDGSSFYGLTGHAAIANGDSYILDAPGYSINTSRGLLNTTRQRTVQQWLDEYTGKGTVWVYRVSSSYDYVAGNAASWADRTYYSSSGSATQDRFPSYGVTLNTKGTDPTYCSKIVYQAYYYGSGNLPFMVPTSTTIIGPYGLLDSFADNYRPSLVKTFY
ncbi:hypothetical protein CBR56_16265 [Bacillus thuringiensis]|uniref:hypothetical protein n=1 Tax=Bacillus TaxID=1386 RepID=UPI000B4490DF|nr:MULTISPECIES: hypothetical protein [Bacillus]MED3033525.1 hypothetical protein [Bacillus tropicus]OTX85330.1 hypothetical protein BK728_12000 [Bacillus thuringiensis serovar chanpaisis]PNK27352.1 hypothetical protein CBR56_16265 [Bacillus thuringiensis]